MATNFKVTRITDTSLTALRRILAQKSGWFLVRVHNYRIHRIHQIDRGQSVDELLEKVEAAEESNGSAAVD